MVVLSTAAFLVAAGFAAWVLGIVFGYPGIGTIGCVLILGAGAMVTTGGLEYQTGERVIENTTFDGHTVNDSTTVYNSTNVTREVTFEYETVETPQRFSLGLLLMLIGGVGILRNFEAISEQ